MEREEHLLRAGAGRRHARGQDVRADQQGDRPDGRLGLPRGLADARLRHPGDDPAGRRAPRARGGEQLHQDPRDARGPAGDRGVDLRRRADQRHAADVDRPDDGGGRGLHEGHRAAHRGRISTRTCLRCSRLFISRWDVAVHDEVPDESKNTLGVAVGKATYKAWREMLESDRWKGLADKGARLQRLLFASTGTKDPEASDTLYIEALRGPGHDQHHARQDPRGLRRPRQGRRSAAGRRRRLPRRSSRLTRTPASTPTRSG